MYIGLTLIGQHGREQFYTFLRVALVMGGPRRVDALEAIDVLHVIEAAQESATRGTVIEL